MNLLTLEHVSKRFGGVSAVDDVSLEVIKGSLTGLIGPNGSGKTTLFNLISGFHKLDAGRVIFNGTDISGKRPHEIFKAGIYRTFQSPQIVPRLSVAENMLLAGRDQLGEGLFSSFFKRRTWSEQESKLIDKALDYLKFLKLEPFADELPVILSGGQLKLLEVGRALMSDSKILLLDEPAAGVNPSLALDIFELLEHLRSERDATIFVIEHKMDLLLQKVDYVYVMNKGKLFFKGAPKDITQEQSVIDVYLGE